MAKKPVVEKPAARTPERSTTESEVRIDETAELSKQDVMRLRAMLEHERNTVLSKVSSHITHAIGDESALADEMDQATRAEDQAMLLRLADKERKLLMEIQHALSKIATGTYGLCEGTSEPIGLRRLEARPWARYSIQYKEQLERDAR